METHCILMVSTFYPPYHLGGDAVHVKYLVDELVRMGHEVHIIHSLDAYSLKKERVKNTDDDVHIHRLHTPFGSVSAATSYISGRNMAAERLVSEVSKEIKSDVIHYHNISLMGCGILRKGTGKKIYTAHDHWAICQRNDNMKYGKTNCVDQSCFKCAIKSHRPARLISNKKIISDLKRLDVIIAPSAYMQNKLEIVGLEPILIKNFTPRVECNTRAQRSHFSYAGVLEKHKGVDILIDAYSKIKSNSELHILGTGSLSEKIEQSNNAQIKHLGFIPQKDVLSDVGSSICLCAPSRCCENSPLSCIEAMSMGVPLVVFPNGGLPELANGCGIVVGDVEGLATALEILENNVEMRTRMSNNALKKYEEEHSPEIFMKQYIPLLGDTA